MERRRSKPSSILEKHKPLSPVEIEAQKQTMKKVKVDITRNAEMLERNLNEFLELEDPLFSPETGKQLCMVRRPTNAELEEMIPAELLAYRNSPEEVPLEVIRKYQDKDFDIMAKLITVPKHDGKWWKEHSNQVLQRLFQKHLANILKDLGIDAENF